MKVKSKIFNKFLLLTLCSIFGAACGLREDDKAYSNPLIGKWYLNEIKCYYPDLATGDRLEAYLVSSFLEVEVVFTARAWTYAVSETTPFTSEKVTTCLTAADGSYRIEYDNKSQGRLNYGNVNTSTGCSVEMVDSSVGSINVPFGFSPLSYNVQDILWEIEEDTGNLILQNSTDFFGSSQSSRCSDSCYCYGFYKKNEES